MNVVCTSLLTATPDPARGGRWDSDVRQLDPMIRSVRGAEVVVFHDCDLDTTGDARFVRVPGGGNPYHQRWRHLAGWLAGWLFEAADVDLLFAVDGTDVEMLHEPWDRMERDHLYVGSEIPSDESHGWLVDTHPSLHGQRLDEPVLNAGILGGHRADVARFAAAMVADLATCGAHDLTDMAAFNRVEAGCDVVLGERVHTRLHGYEDDHPTAWWRHK